MKVLLTCEHTPHVHTHARTHRDETRHKEKNHDLQKTRFSKIGVRAKSIKKHLVAFVVEDIEEKIEQALGCVGFGFPLYFSHLATEILYEPLARKGLKAGSTTYLKWLGSWEAS
ncbi:hypothetical protein EVAR_7079_1 [Eumeta japonica]|uniref:Uncharacterized protein n=1 Tax=Eumeta variegata TaxID=151549 RepID=A0A4C1X8G3_EUMVA|nr:hypothetical protein EVAR_7079_1 [Eumeta japonica]